MDSMTVPADMFGAPEMKFGPQKRLGNELSRMSQIQDGRWKVVSDYVKP
jgi:branched-chain amino acid transport system substrate-binding protein